MTNQTPESVIAEALNAWPRVSESSPNLGVADYLTEALRAANMLREPGVPDAATEAVWKEGYDLQTAELMKVAAERDAATAALERARVIHVRDEYGLCAECSWEYPDASYDAISNDVAWPCPTVAALDGAPEPEWEYGVSVDGLDGEPEPRFTRDSVQHMIDHPDLYRKWTHGNPVIMHRRIPSGPWLPVEGESK